MNPILFYTACQGGFSLEIYMGNLYKFNKNVFINEMPSIVKNVGIGGTYGEKYKITAKVQCNIG